ncbi:MAG TPA: hypothetical protein VG897_04380 [Terriglobales bacterium]|nr:hypothetical protein [Terriglobales bacterium]
MFEAEEESRRWWRSPKSPQTIARILGLLLFGLLFWLQSPPAFLRSAGLASYIFVFLLWIGELLVYTIFAAGLLVILIFAGSYLYTLLRNARRWFRLQEIRSWRAKRACNFHRENLNTEPQSHRAN